MMNKKGMLVLLATPIGNLGDLSERAIQTLRQADLIAAEDTRVTGRLLQKLGLKKPMVACHDHNEGKVVARLLAEMAEGKNIVLASDAGTPLVSDPGYKVVQAVIAEGYPLTAIPGPSAPILALILSGLPSDRFFFGGFLPAKEKERQDYLHTLKDIPATLLFFETAPRLASALADAAAILGARSACVARELTKLYEEIIRGTLPELAHRYREAQPKGEIVLVIAPPLPKEAPSEEEINERLAFYLHDHSPSQAASLAAKDLGLKRKDLYDRAMKRK